MAESSGGNGKNKLTPSHCYSRNKEAPSLEYHTGDMDSTPDTTCSQSSDDTDSNSSYHTPPSSPSQPDQLHPKDESEMTHPDPIRMVSTCTYSYKYITVIASTKIIKDI